MDADFKPLMPRVLNKEIAGITYAEYEKLADSPLIARIKARTDPHISAETNLFENKIQYLIETVADMRTKKTELLELWTLFEKIAKEKTDLSNLYSIYMLPLVSLTGEAMLNAEEKNKLDCRLDQVVKEYLQRQIDAGYDFAKIIEELIAWQNYHLEFLGYLGLGFQLSETSYLKSLYEDNVPRFEMLKSTSPLTFLRFIQLIKYHYKTMDKDYRQKHQDFYLKRCLEQIIVARNSGNFVDYDALQEDYYSEKHGKNSFFNLSLKYLVGYGEKPWRLVVLFFGLNLLFSLLFTFGSFEFKLIPDLSRWEKFCTFLSFNNTSMLTVGYGDVYPEGPGARLMVALLQILGFAISGSVIALFLRKILRF